MANIICTKLTLEDINACFLRLSRTMNNNQASLQSQVTNIISSSIETKDKYNDTAIRALIDALTSRVTDDERDIMNLEGKTQDLSAKIANLSTVVANINCSYNADTNTLTFTNSTGLATNYELKDTTYTFSFDTETQTLTVHNDLDGEDTSNDFVQQITGTTYTFTWNNGTLTIHDNLADTDTTIDLDSRYYTESEIDAFITDINNNHNALANRVTTIEGKIPSAASSSNQLADKEYVNHSITTATATFRGTVETTSALAALTGDLNDYAFLKIYDETTHSYSYDRYKWVESGGDYGHWKYEYSIENTEFTAPQWEALNSGITCSLVDKITDVYNCKITLCQNGTCKGSFTLNQSSNQTINLDNSTVCAHSSTNINSDLPLLACCSSSTGTLEDAYFNPDVSVNTCCGSITACSFCLKRGGTASRRIIYNSKDYTGGTRCKAMDIRMFMECFASCHCLFAGDQLDVKYTWADACNNIICWGNNSSLSLSGGHVSIINNTYDSRLFNDNCSGWTHFSIEVSSSTGVVHTFRAYKGCSSATTAIITCDAPYDYLSYNACNARTCGVDDNIDYRLLLGTTCEYSPLYYSCNCQVTFNPSTGQLCLGPYTVLNPISCVGIQMNAPDSCVTDGVFINRNNGCSIGLRLGTGINRGFFDCEGGTARWLTYYNATCEVHCLPQSFGCTDKCISIPAGTTYVLIGCICAHQYSHGTKLGITVGGSNAVNKAELDMLLTTSSPSCFECNNISVNISNYQKSRYGILGVGFISTNPTGCSTYSCPVCVVLQVCNVSSSALSWHFDVFGLKTQCWTTDIQCLGSTAPTFTKLIPIPACCRSYTYSNASQGITGNLCGTLNGCGIADIVNDSVACAYSGLGASINGESFTSSSGCLTLDDFSFDKVCDACVYCVSCGDVVRRIIESNQISEAGYRQRIGLGLDRYQNGWGYGLLSIGINDAGTCFTDYRFSCAGAISSHKCGTAQCITVLGRATDNVYRCDLPRPGGTTAACKWYVQVCTSSCRNNRSDSVYISLYSMDATLNLNAPVQYYCGSYYGGLCYSKCAYTCSNAECFWLAYTGYYYPVLCSSRCFTVLQCTHTAPEGVTFSCFCDIVTAGVSGIQSIDFNGSSFTVSSGAATLEMTPDICYDTATSCMCVILGNQESTKVDLSSLASDHLVAYGGLCSAYDRPLLFGTYGAVDGCICKVYFSSGCPITFNACTGLLNVKGIICSQCYFRGLLSTFTSYTWAIPSGTSSRPTVRLMYDITCWAKCTTGQTSKGIVGNIYHARLSGYGASSINNIVALASYGRNGCSWDCCNTGCIKLVYDYSLGTVIDRPVIVYDSTNDKYWLGLCTSGTSSQSVRFDGFMSSALESSCVLCTDASGCLPTGWSFCTYGTRYFPGKCLFLYCGNTCKCVVDWQNCNICLSANAFNQYAEVDETTYPGVCCTGDVCQADIASFITMTDVDNCGFMKNFCVYCGSTCKCKISNAGCLKLCANAFNANAQISTSTYPGACCTGTIQGICLNGQEFTTTSGIASLTGFAACDLSTVDNAHTLINGNQCYVFFGCSLSYCCNGTQYALLLRGCAERAGKAMLKCTCENQSYIVPFICKCALGSDCTADFYRSCNDNEPKFNPSTGQLCSCIVCSPKYEFKTNCEACYCGNITFCCLSNSESSIRFTTNIFGRCGSGCFGTCKNSSSTGWSFFKADRMCGDWGCLCCVHSCLVCSDRYENQCICCGLTFTCGQYACDYILLGCTCAICNYKNIDEFVYAIHNNGIADKDNMICVTFQPASIGTSCINNLKITKSGSRDAPVRIQGIGYINNGNGTYCWVAQLARGTISTANVAYCNLLYLNKVNTLFTSSIQHLDSVPTFTCYIPLYCENETYDNGRMNFPNLTTRYKYVCCCTGPSNDGCSGAAILITFCGSSVGFTKDIILRIKSTDGCNHDEYSTTYLSVLNGYPNAYCGSLNGCVSYNMPGYDSYITHIVEGVGFAVEDGCPQIVVSVCKCAATQLVFDVYEAKDVTCGGCVTAPAGAVTSAICSLCYENDSEYIPMLKQYLSCWTALGSYNTTGTNFASTLNTNMVLTCCVSTTSDVRCKKNILPFNNGINILKCTDIIQYNYIGENDNCVPHVGIPANWSCQLLSGKDQNTFRVNDALGITMDAVKDLISSMTLGQKIKLWLTKKFREVKQRKELINKINKYKRR